MSNAYKTVRMLTDHPLRVPGSDYAYIYEHRLVLWEKIGPGTHPCHHCGEMVTWMPGAGSRRGALVVDHLDDDKRNNEPENLAPSCLPCNQLRTPRKNRVRDNELWVPHLADGTRVRAVQVICPECRSPFLTPRRNDEKMQKFCSRACAGANKRSALGDERSVTNHRFVKDDELFVMHPNGTRARAVRNLCAWCGYDYLVIKSAAPRSKYCGEACRLAGFKIARRKKT